MQRRRRIRPVAAADRRTGPDRRTSVSGRSAVPDDQCQPDPADRVGASAVTSDVHDPEDIPAATFAPVADSGTPDFGAQDFGTPDFGTLDPGAPEPGLADPEAVAAVPLGQVRGVDQAMTSPPHRVTEAGSERDDPTTDRGLRNLVGGGASQVGVVAALRARDAARPTEGDLAEAAADLVIVRRGWTPRADLPRGARSR